MSFGNLKQIVPNFESAMYRLRNEGQTNLFLYYYTNPDTFFKILDNRCIKTSKYESVNDLDEANLDCLNGSLRRFEIENYIRKTCHFISFVQDYNKYHVTIEGTQHPRMWAQYAQNNEGVCLILNKKELVRRCRLVRGRNSVMIGKIRYRWSKYFDEESEVINTFYDNLSIEDILKRYGKHIFLTKHIDWEQEHEIRLCLMDNREKDMINIDGCIEGICLGNKFIENSELLLKFVEKLECSNNKFHNQIGLDAFGVIANTIGSYDAWPIHPQIDVKISKVVNSLCKLLSRT